MILASDIFHCHVEGMLDISFCCKTSTLVSILPYRFLLLSLAE